MNKRIFGTRQTKKMKMTLGTRQSDKMVQIDEYFFFQLPAHFVDYYLEDGMKETFDDHLEGNVGLNFVQQQPL